MSAALVSSAGAPTQSKRDIALDPQPEGVGPAAYHGHRSVLTTRRPALDNQHRTAYGRYPTVHRCAPFPSRGVVAGSSFLEMRGGRMMARITFPALPLAPALAIAALLRAAVPAHAQAPAKQPARRRA